MHLNMNKEDIHNLEESEHLSIKKLIKKMTNDSQVYGLIRFGSSVKSPKYNDIDLCIVSRKDITAEKRLKYRVFLEERFDVQFFHELPLYIQHKVLKYGIYEYIRDYDTLFDICVQSIREYSLFEPHYKMYLELIRDY
ncbi:MAG: hypothetical protein GF353_11525 [Candidatus Lokiarchaeota archaeon]|nr:hypothetical protein [Candidatus Lokiarchaeota archaeon]